MNANEIVNVLRACGNGNSVCEKCPFYIREDSNECRFNAIYESADTIEAQQQEIERLNKVLDDWKYNAKCDADHIAGLLADKDEQAGRIMGLDYLLRRTLPILEATNNQQELIEAIDALLGGKDDED